MVGKADTSSARQAATARDAKLHSTHPQMTDYGCLGSSMWKLRVQLGSGK